MGLGMQLASESLLARGTSQRACASLLPCAPSWVVGRRNPICIGVGSSGRWGACMVDPIDWLERLGVGLYMQIVIDVLVGGS